MTLVIINSLMGTLLNCDYLWFFRCRGGNRRGEGIVVAQESINYSGLRQVLHGCLRGTCWLLRISGSAWVREGLVCAGKVRFRFPAFVLFEYWRQGLILNRPAYSAPGVGLLRR